MIYMPNRLLGDFNNNGIVDATDSSNIKTYVIQRNMKLTIDPPKDQEDLAAGDIMCNDDITLQAGYIVGRSFAMNSVKSRVYPKYKPDNWEVNVYKDYFYIDDQGNEVSLSDLETAPTWVDKKYYYKSSDVASSFLGTDYIRTLTVQMP